MKQKFLRAHLAVAHEYAKLSSARRLQVGAIVVKDDRIIIDKKITILSNRNDK